MIPIWAALAATAVALAGGTVVGAIIGTLDHESSGR